MLTSLPPLTFLALLLAGKFIELKLNSKGFYSVMVLIHEWKSFFDQYGLKARGSSERDGITSHLQLGSVYNYVLTCDKPTEKQGDHNLHNKMHLLRVGMIPTGAPIPPGSVEINRHLAPPSHVNMKIYTEQNKTSLTH